MHIFFCGMPALGTIFFAEHTVLILIFLHPYPFHSLILIAGRYDLRLPDYVIAQLGLDAALEPILTRLASIMGSPKPQVRTQNVIFVPVGR